MSVNVIGEAGSARTEARLCSSLVSQRQPLWQCALFMSTSGRLRSIDCSFHVFNAGYVSILSRLSHYMREHDLKQSQKQEAAVTSRMTSLGCSSSVPEQHSFYGLATMYIMCRMLDILGRICLDELIVREFPALMCRQQLWEKFLRVTIALITSDVSAS